MVIAVTFMGRPRSRVRTWPSAPARTHTQARVRSDPATACAAVDPRGQSADAVNGIGASAPELGSGAAVGDGAAETTDTCGANADGWSETTVFVGRMASMAADRPIATTMVRAMKPITTGLLKRAGAASAWSSVRASSGSGPGAGSRNAVVSAGLE